MKSYGHKEVSKDKLKVVTTDPPGGAEPIDIGVGESVKGYKLESSKAHLKEW